MSVVPDYEQLIRDELTNLGNRLGLGQAGQKTHGVTQRDLDYILTLALRLKAEAVAEEAARWSNQGGNDDDDL